MYQQPFLVGVFVLRVQKAHSGFVELHLKFPSELHFDQIPSVFVFFKKLSQDI